MSFSYQVMEESFWPNKAWDKKVQEILNLQNLNNDFLFKQSSKKSLLQVYN